MMNPHISALMLDALALGALDALDEQRVRTHLASCAICRAEQEAAADLRARFATHVLPRGLAGLPEPRASRARRWPWLALPALAVLALLVVRWPRPDPLPELAIKGDPSLQVYAHRDGNTFSVRDGAELAPGDRIRFVVFPAGARYVLVASVDGSSAATIYYPYGGDHSAAVEADRVEPNESIVLDAAPGPERLYALLSDRPLAASLVIARLREVAAGGANAIRETRALALPVRAQPSLAFEKARP